jgi:hypothetical protein
LQGREQKPNQKDVKEGKEPEWRAQQVTFPLPSNIFGSSVPKSEQREDFSVLSYLEKTQKQEFGRHFPKRGDKKREKWRRKRGVRKTTIKLIKRGVRGCTKT